MQLSAKVDASIQVAGGPLTDWLDLSAGTNPRPYKSNATAWPRPVGSAAPGALIELLAIAADSYDVQRGFSVVAAPGRDTLILALRELINGPIALIGSAGEFYRETFGSDRLIEVEALEGLSERTVNAIVLMNPDAYEGRLLSAREILTLVRRCGPDEIVVIDECYAEAEPSASVVPHLRAGDPVLVLKSFECFYGLTGLRLSFAVGADGTIASLAAFLGDDSIPAFDAAVGSAALADHEWRARTRHWLGNQAQSLDAVLKSGGLEPAGGCRLFRVGLAEDAQAVHAKLAKRGVWTRIFGDRPRLIRFGLPADAKGLARLAGALAEP